MKSIGIQYNVKLQKIVRMVRRDIDEYLVPVVKQYAPEYVADAVVLDAWPDAVKRVIDFLLLRWTSPAARQAATSIASEFVQSAARFDERRQRNTVGINVFSGSNQMVDYLQAATIQNAALITSIPAQYLGEVGNLVMTNMRAGMRPSYIEQALVQQFGVTQRRAKMIARDQTAKVAGDIAEKRQRAAGFQFFQWVDSDDQRVRHRHREIADKVTAYGPGVYRWDNLPLSDKGQPIKPGQDYQCRCIAKAVTPAQVERYKRDGKTTPGVTR